MPGLAARLEQTRCRLAARRHRTDHLSRSAAARGGRSRPRGRSGCPRARQQRPPRSCVRRCRANGAAGGCPAPAPAARRRTRCAAQRNVGPTGRPKRSDNPSKYPSVLHLWSGDNIRCAVTKIDERGVTLVDRRGRRHVRPQRPTDGAGTGCRRRRAGDLENQARTSADDPAHAAGQPADAFDPLDQVATISAAGWWRWTICNSKWRSGWSRKPFLAPPWPASSGCIRTRPRRRPRPPPTPRRSDPAAGPRPRRQAPDDVRRKLCRSDHLRPQRRARTMPGRHQWNRSIVSRLGGRSGRRRFALPSMEAARRPRSDRCLGRRRARTPAPLRRWSASRPPISRSAWSAASDFAGTIIAARSSCSTFGLPGAGPACRRCRRSTKSLRNLPLRTSAWWRSIFRKRPTRSSKRSTSCSSETTVGLDTDGAVAKKYGATAIPQTVIVGRDGNVARVFVGGGPQFDEQLRSAVQSVVTGKPETAE